MVVKQLHNDINPEAPMPSLTIRDLPPEVHAALVRRAKDHGRSLNGEVLEVLSRAAATTTVDPDAFLREAREVRRRFGVRPIPDLDRLLGAARRGRP